MPVTPVYRRGGKQSESADVAVLMEVADLRLLGGQLTTDGGAVSQGSRCRPTFTATSTKTNDTTQQGLVAGKRILKTCSQ